MTAFAMPSSLPRRLTASFWFPLLMGALVLATLALVIGLLVTVIYVDRAVPPLLVAVPSLGLAYLVYLMFKLACSDRTAYLMWSALPEDIVDAMPHQRRERLREFIRLTGWLDDSLASQEIFARKLFLLERACALQDRLVQLLLARARRRPFACLQREPHRQALIESLLADVTVGDRRSTQASLLNIVRDPAYPRGN